MEPEAEDDAGSRFVRTQTVRTAARSDDLDGLGAKLESIEERLRNIEDVPLASMQKVLIDLRIQLEQLDGKFDEAGVSGLTGESSLRSRKKAMLERCETLHTEVGAKLQAVQDAQQTAPDDGMDAQSSCSSGSDGFDTPR
jgi:ABC-type phosphate transport system auxiliary subunit